jgi:hypothetical protein
MEFEEILGSQFTGFWSTCSPIPEKRFPISYDFPGSENDDRDGNQSAMPTGSNFQEGPRYNSNRLYKR